VETEHLIAALAREAGPVRPLAAPRIRLARFAASTGLLLALGIWLWGPRADLGSSLGSPMFVTLAFLTLLTAGAASARTFALSVPGFERVRGARWAPIASGLVWAILLATALGWGEPLGPEPSVAFYETCVFRIASLSVLPGGILFIMLRRAAPLRLGWTTGLAALAAFAWAALAVQFICPINAPAHLLQSHVGTVAVGTLAGFGVGSVFHRLASSGAKAHAGHMPKLKP
jgi:hypothetical protein